MFQNYVSEPVDLLDADGNVINPGYCFYNNYIYKRDAIKANGFRIKEWDFYQISNEIFTLQFNIADISMGGAFTFALINRLTGDKAEFFDISLLTKGKLNLEEDTNKPHFIKYEKKKVSAQIQVTPNKRYLTANFKKHKDLYEVFIELSVMDNLQSLIMAVPFKQKGHFYLNQKTNSMPASGYVKKNGIVISSFDKSSSFGVLDWGRGVWPYSGKWYWGNGSSYLDGHIFGFEIGWGFGDMSNATENTLFYDGVAHKIEEVYLKKDDTDYMKPWIFTSNDGRFEMTMIPEYDNFTSTRVGLVGNVCHQVFGKWNGTVALDDGTKLEIKDMIAFCEYSDNKW